MRVLMALFPLLLIVSCVLDGQPRLHEVVLHGSEGTRLSYLYGTPTSIKLGEDVVELSREVTETDDPLAVAEALSIDGRRYLRERIPPLTDTPGEVQRIGRSSDLRVRLERDTGPVLYFDGRMWFTLLGDGRAGVDTRVVPRPRIGGLRGVGELTRAEADALTSYLEAGGPVSVIVLDEVEAPRRAGDGISEYVRTGLYLQREFEVVRAERRPVQQELVWEVMAGGQQASGFEGQSFFLVQDSDTLRGLWNRAHGAQLQVPPVPEVNFSRETVVAIFLGTKPTGGYGVSVEQASLEGGELYVDVALSEPGPDTIVTQALTSPWVMVRVLRGGIDAAWVRRAGSEVLLGAARPAF